MTTTPENIGTVFKTTIAPEKAVTKTDNLPSTPPNSKENPKDPRKKNLIQKFAQTLAGRVLLVSTAVASIGGVGYVTYDNLTSQEAVVPSTFDNAKDKQIIGDNNTKVPTSEDKSKIPSFDKDGKPILFFPARLPPGTSIEVTKELSEGFWSKDMLEKARQDQVRDYVVLRNVPAGTEFEAPITSNTFSWEVERNGQTITIGISFTFMGPDGMLRVVTMATQPSANSTTSPIELLIDATKPSPDNSNGRDWEKGMNAEKHQLVFRTNQNLDISIASQAATNQSLGPEGERSPSNITFATGSSALFVNRQ